jgi:hypothetical protein
VSRSSRTRSANLVKHVQPDVGAHIQTSPDRRLCSLKINSYAEERGLPAARLPQRWTLFGLCRHPAREREKLASQLLKVIEFHAGGDFVESPVEFSWV